MILLEPYTSIVSPAALMCSQGSISILSNSSVRADGLGCVANTGESRGYYMSAGAGSGAGNGGNGGSVTSPGGVVVPGGKGLANYPQAGDPFSSGSGGGCSLSDCGGYYNVNLSYSTGYS